MNRFRLIIILVIMAFLIITVLGLEVFFECNKPILEVEHVTSYARF